MRAYAFTPAGAAHATEAGELDAWADAFLRGPGHNLPFADGLKRARRGWRLEPEYPLAGLQRLCGPEANLPFAEDAASFERRVSAMRAALDAGWSPPPLIVYAPDRTVNDGSHRLEALRRAGRSRYAALLWWTAP